MIIYIILGIIAIVIICKLLFSYKLKLQTINFYSGGLGSGKTLKAVDTAIKLRRRSILANKLFAWNLGKLPRFKDRFKIRKIYSNFPILLKGKYKDVIRVNDKIKALKEQKGKEKEIDRLQKYAKEHFVFSIPLTKDHMIGKARVEEHSIIVLDEVQIMFPNQKNRSDPEVIWNMTFARHFHNSTIIMCSQSIGNVDVAIRRVVNVLYNLSSFKKVLFFFYKIDVNKINYMEDVVVNTNDVNEDDCLKLFSIFGKRRYNSRYMKDYYKPDDMINNNYEFTNFKLNPLDNYMSLTEYKEAFYGWKKKES